MGEFGSWVFWKRNPVFVLIFHLWENFCHWQFKGHAANIMSICCYTGIYDFIELGQKVCGWVEMFRGWRWGEEGEKKKKKQSADLEWGWKIRTYFCFKCVSVHIWSLFWPIYQESQRWPMTQLLRLTWFWLSHSEFNLTLCPWSSRVTSREQQINPMCQTWHDTMFSQALLFKYSRLFHLLAFDVKPSLVLSFFVGYFKFYLSSEFMVCD